MPLTAPLLLLTALELHVSGYAQPQLVHSQLSEDEVTPDGDAQNRDRFLVRRARLRLDGALPYGGASLELDGSTVYGPTVRLRRAEAFARLPHLSNEHESLPDYARLSAGLGDIPFGYELTQGSGQRLFTERSAGSRAFFVGEADVGATLSGGLGPFRYAVAAQNGVPQSESPDADNSVYTGEKTGVGRLSFEAGLPQRLELSGGVSALRGVGLHQGTPATKASLSWDDTNQDGFVNLDELEALSAQAATPSSTFDRWAVNADLQVGLRTPLGWTRVLGELTMASNLDQGYYVADPVSTGYDLRELAWNAALIQEIALKEGAPVGLVAFRADRYDGNADLFESRRGQFVPLSATQLTLSPLIGAELPGRGKLIFQYDYVVDFLGRDVTGEPVDLPNDQWTLRAQVEL